LLSLTSQAISATSKPQAPQATITLLHIPRSLFQKHDFIAQQKMAKGMMKGIAPLGILLFAGVFILATDIALLRSTFEHSDNHNMAPLPSRPVLTRLPARMNGSSQLDNEWLQDTWTTVTRQVGWKLPNILPRRSKVVKDGVTLAVHTGATINGLNRMLFLIHRWGGPVSVSIRVTSSSEIQTFQEFVTQHLEPLQQTAIHLLMESRDNKYPHNILREMAMEQTETDYFLALDVDFMTIPNCHDKLQMLLRNDQTLVDALHNKTMMILPAFNHEFKLKDEQLQDSVLPSTKEDAMQMVQRNELTPFHVARFFPGHGPTDFNKWFKEDFDESWYAINYVIRFEPYVLGYKPGIPHYWEGFRGFGFNKLSWFIELDYMGYQFGVLRDFFVVHLDHSYNRIRGTQKGAFEELDRFRDYLVEEYGADRKDLAVLSQTLCQRLLRKLRNTFGIKKRSP
jgi:hypothetical protein